MGVLNVLLLVFFIIVAVLLVLLVLIQNEEGDSLGGIFAGGSGSAFGSRSGNVLTRTTTILGALFLALCLSLALINRTPGASGVEAAGRQLDAGASGDWWQKEDAPEAGEAAPEPTVDGLETAAPVSELSPEAGEAVPKLVVDRSERAAPVPKVSPEAGKAVPKPAVDGSETAAPVPELSPEAGEAAPEPAVDGSETAAPVPELSPEDVPAGE